MNEERERRFKIKRIEKELKNQNKDVVYAVLILGMTVVYKILVEYSVLTASEYDMYCMIFSSIADVLPLASTAALTSSLVNRTILRNRLNELKSVEEKNNNDERYNVEIEEERRGFRR